jgi:hypothetical protein
MDDVNGYDVQICGLENNALTDGLGSSLSRIDRVVVRLKNHPEGRTAFHSFSPWGRRWDEGAPALRSGIIVTPSPHPLPCGARE